MSVLIGTRSGQYSIRVNDQYRLCFTWKDGEARVVEFVTTINRYISTPGEILLEEFLEPLGISQYRLAKAIKKPQSAISDIVNGRRAISVEMAMLLAKALGTSPEFWLNLESTYQVKTFDTSSIPDVALLTA